MNASEKTTCRQRRLITGQGVGVGVGRIRDPTGGLLKRRQDKAVEGAFAGSGGGERKGSRTFSDGRDRVRCAVCADGSFSPTNISESCSGGRITK